MSDTEQALAVRMAAAGARVEYEATRNRITLMPSSLAYFKMLLATDEGAAIAREAAVGRAVLRLADSIAWTLRGGPDGSNTEAWSTQTGAVGSGDSIPAAIAAALGDDDGIR